MLHSFRSHYSASGPIRFVHLGVAAALAAATLAAIGVVRSAGADPGVASSFVPIVPCRLADTRPGANHVGVRATALGAAEIVPFEIWGMNGHCEIPSTATGIVANVTAVNPSALSYVTVYPSDAISRPLASNLNFVAGSPPTPNQVTVALSASGSISAFNKSGTVDLIIDIAGYYRPAGSGSVTFTGLNATFNPGQATIDPTNGCASLLPATGQLFVALTVPDGATVVAVRVRSSDSAAAPQFASSTDYSLYRVNQGIAETLVASFTSVDGLIDTPMVFGPQISVSLGNAYYLKATVVAGVASQGLCSVTVDYTM